jgi:hypothetical protein
MLQTSNDILNNDQKDRVIWLGVNGFLRNALGGLLAIF